MKRKTKQNKPGKKTNKLEKPEKRADATCNCGISFMILRRNYPAEIAVFFTKRKEYV